MRKRKAKKEAAHAAKPNAVIDDPYADCSTVICRGSTEWTGNLPLGTRSVMVQYWVTDAQGKNGRWMFNPMLYPYKDVQGSAPLARREWTLKLEKYMVGKGPAAFRCHYTKYRLVPATENNIEQEGNTMAGKKRTTKTSTRTRSSSEKTSTRTRSSSEKVGGLFREGTIPAALYTALGGAPKTLKQLFVSIKDLTNDKLEGEKLVRLYLSRMRRAGATVKEAPEGKFSLGTAPKPKPAKKKVTKKATKKKVTKKAASKKPATTPKPKDKETGVTVEA